MTGRWSKNGGALRDLPFEDRAPDNMLYTDLPHNSAGRAACGWVETNCPASVSRWQAKEELRRRGLLTAITSDILLNGSAALVLLWTEASDFHRDNPDLIGYAIGKGWSSTFLDDLFIEAKLIA